MKKQEEVTKNVLLPGFADGTGIIDLVWFRGDKWIPDTYRPGNEYIIFGKPSSFKERINIIHPEIDEISKAQDLMTRLQPMYITTEKLKNNYLTSKAIHKLIQTLLKITDNKIEESLPAWLTKEASLIPLLSLSTIYISLKIPPFLKKLNTG